jgi:ribosomal protein S18 acetylase RimI-like enzyme
LESGPDDLVTRPVGASLVGEAALTSRHFALAVEELSLNAWPSLQTVLYDGWLLRLSRGYTRRANSINPIYGSTLPLDEKIRYCERVYSDRGQDAVFKISPAVQPTDLDAALEERGYGYEAPTSVQVVDLSDVESGSDEAITLECRLEPVWITDFCRLNAIPERHVATMTAMLDSIAPSTCFATLHHEGEVAAVGMAVRERDHVGLFDIVTAPHWRRQGIGRRLVLELLRWGKDGGAGYGYLQVMTSNTPALHLYEKLGFRQAYRYGYRVRSHV